jgi:hypothetical protein
MKPTGCHRRQWILCREAHLADVQMSVLLLRAHHASLAKRGPHNALCRRGVPHYKGGTARWRLYYPGYPRFLLVNLQLPIPILWRRIHRRIVHLDLKALLTAMVPYIRLRLAEGPCIIREALDL